MSRDVPQSLEGMRERLVHGVVFGGVRLFATGLRKGRFKKEFDLELCVGHGEQQEHLLFLKGFEGWMPDYRPWVELFSIQFTVSRGDKRIEFADSEVEAGLLSLVASSLGPGSHVFVEYYGDDETRKSLEMNVPPAATRLGYKLLQLGFTWFKDWYFPEGFLEGGQKLQAQKPLDEVSRVRQLRSLGERLQAFLRSHSDTEGDTPLSRSVVRAGAVLKSVDERLA
jgi:hypothetical protein